MSWKAAAGLRFPEGTAEVIASLGEHRTLSIAQVRAIHFPDRGVRRAQQVLAYLERLARCLLAHQLAHSLAHGSGKPLVHAGLRARPGMYFI